MGLSDCDDDGVWTSRGEYSHGILDEINKLFII